jgi:hypothetical protein
LYWPELRSTDLCGKHGTVYHKTIAQSFIHEWERLRSV